VLDEHGVDAVCIAIPSGNYSPQQIAAALNSAILDAGFSNAETPNPTFVAYNSSNGKLTLSLFGAAYAASPFLVNARTKLVFYDFSAKLQCDGAVCRTPGGFMNQSLGWLLGFRRATEFVRENGNTGVAVVDLNGPKYLILVIDDFNQNRVNNGIVTITELSTKLKMPAYYSPTLPFIRENKNNNNDNNNLDDDIDGNLLAESSAGNAAAPASIPILVPSAPRTLTFSQLYTINEITKNKITTSTNHRPKAPTSSDIMAILPLKGGSASIPTGTLLAEFSGSLQQNVRTYFGPVNIDRMAVKLLDDKGNILNLNGCDWCVTLIATCLYQY
jgi:hypothetical protein